LLHIIVLGEYNILSLTKDNDRKINLIGKKFGKLVVVAEGKTKNRHAHWLCRCSCGKEKEICGNTLRRGEAKSCGCLRKSPNCRWKGHKKISGAYWYAIKDGAKRRKINFDLSIEDAWSQYEIQNGKCALSGQSIDFIRHKNAGEQTASLDRKKSDEGYHKDNIQWVHKKINSMKLKMSDAEFIGWCQKVISNEQFDCTSL
jgi:hypothetical protein